jgi:hypothetical protein
MQMNWEERLSRWADKLEVAGDKTVDFASAEIPEYLRELLAWEFWLNLSIGSLLLLVLVLGLYLARKGYYAGKKSGFDEPGLWTIGIIFGMVSVLACGPLSIVHLGAAAKVKVAPRVVIVEKIQGLARGHR